MKLRIRGNSLRLRISRTEMARLLADGRIADTVYFAPQPEARLTYALEHRPTGRDVRVEYSAQQVTVVVSIEAVTNWAESDAVGIYASVETGHGPLELMVEKDFACLDGNDPVDPDAFPNPAVNLVC
jgi:hypothetical protein